VEYFEVLPWNSSVEAENNNQKPLSGLPVAGRDSNWVLSEKSLRKLPQRLSS
jgi:hypothetical protein